MGRLSAARHTHSHGLVDEGIKRSREGVRAGALALAVLALTAAIRKPTATAAADATTASET